MTRSYHVAVAMWHCPHCGAPQAETARCWVCRRSSTTCSTCRHFRPSLASDIGYCALDRARRPLTGRELRGCWTQPPIAAEPPDATHALFSSRGSELGTQPSSRREFIPLDDLVPIPTAVESGIVATLVVLVDAVEAGEARTSLFGELDR